MFMHVGSNHSANSMLTVWAAGSREPKNQKPFSLDDALVQSLVKNIAPQAEGPEGAQPRLDVQA